MKRSKFPMVNLWGFLLISIPAASYGATSIDIFLYPILIALIYSTFSALKRHHENQPFVDRAKVKIYSQIFTNTKLILLLGYWTTEGLGVYQVVS